MRPPFCCRPSGSPSEAMGNTGSGNPHRLPDGDNLSRRPAVRSRLQKTGRLHLAAAAFPNAFPVGGRLVPRKSGRFNSRLVCAASYKPVWRPHLRFASRRKNRFLGRLPRAGKRPKHRRAKPRRRGPRLVRDGRRGWMGKGRSGVAVRRHPLTPHKPGLSAAKRRRRAVELSSNHMPTKIILTNFAIFVMMNVGFLRSAYF